MVVRTSSKYIFTTLGYATHGLLDSCTSYGTQLFWPFSDYRVSWNYVSIVDFIYTVPLTIFCILAIVKKSPKLAIIGVVLSSSYLALGAYQKHRVDVAVQGLAADRGHKIERSFYNPTIANNILWRSVYQSGDKYYIDAVHVPYFGEPSMREGQSVDVVNIDAEFKHLTDNDILLHDIKRFDKFSSSYLYRHKDYPNSLFDLRYGTKPYNIEPFWGIAMNPNQPNKHVQRLNVMKFDKGDWQELWDTLKNGYVSTVK